MLVKDGQLGLPLSVGHAPFTKGQRLQQFQKLRYLYASALCPEVARMSRAALSLVS